MLAIFKTFSSNKVSAAVAAVFAADSLLFGSWLSRIPAIQSNLHLSEGDLGWALLGAPAGALLSMPFAQRFVRVVGMNRAALVAALVFTGVAILPTAAFNFATLFGALVAVGIVGSLLNVAMNAAAATAERAYGISIMSACHGIYSLGGMVGAGLSVFFVAGGVSPALHLAAMSAGVLLLLAIIRPFFLQLPRVLNQPAQTATTATSKLPFNRTLIGLIAIGFCIMLGEAAVSDWSAVFIANVLESQPAISGLGFAGFSLTMAVGRLNGDAVTARWGGQRTVAAGSLLGAVGMFLAIGISNPATAIIGFSLVGLGYSCVVPTLYAVATRIPNIAPETSIATIATSGIIGFLIGPPVIGWVAESVNLYAALGGVGCLGLVAMAWARWMRWY